MIIARFIAANILNFIHIFTEKIKKIKYKLLVIIYFTIFAATT